MYPRNELLEGTNGRSWVQAEQAVQILVPGNRICTDVPMESAGVGSEESCLQAFIDGFHFAQELRLSRRCFLAHLRHLQMRSDASQEFARGKWLYKIIVCAAFQSLHTGFFPRASGKQDNRKSGGSGILSNGAQ